MVPNTLLMGLYFGQFAFWIGLFCLIAEISSPELNGRGWRMRYVGLAWKLLVPGTLLLLFVGGLLLQMAYGLNVGKEQPARNILIVMDVSESMAQTDPERESFRAAKDLVASMEPDKRVAVITFNEQASVLQPFVQLSDTAAKNEVIAKLDGYGKPAGQTDIAKALSRGVEEVKAVRGDGSKTMVILLSDGASKLDSSVLTPFEEENIAVNTIGMKLSDWDGRALLKRIARETGGSFHRVDDVKDLSGVVSGIYQASQRWHLLESRPASTDGSPAYTALRILSITLLGGLLGLSLGIVFDNRYLVRSFALGGLIAGLLAGLVLETGMRGGAAFPWTYRLLADWILAGLLPLSTAVFAYKQGSSLDEGRSMGRTGRRPMDDSRSSNSSGRKFR